MQKLLTYEEYREHCLGEPLAKKVFNKLITKAVLKFNYFTANRIKNYDSIPIEVKFTLCEFVDILNSLANNGITGLSSYSNGIESFGYVVDTDNPEKLLNVILWNKIKENLSDFPELTYRGL